MATGRFPPAFPIEDKETLSGAASRTDSQVRIRVGKGVGLARIRSDPGAGDAEMSL